MAKRVKRMKTKCWDIGLLFLILLCSTIGIRVYYINCLMKDVVMIDDVAYYLEAIGTSYSFNVHMGVKALYFAALYLTDIFVGDFERAGVYLNVIFQAFTVIMIFWYIYYMTKKYYGFRFGMLLTVFPAYIHKISVIGYFSLSFLLVVLLLVIIALVYNFLRRSSLNKNIKNINENNEEIQMPVQEADSGEISVYSDTSMKEIVMADFAQSDVKLLDNPLPLPKKKEHREMEYAIELTPLNDDYDIKELPEGDDFDI